MEDADKLGVNESFEARIRGALSPYWTLTGLCELDLTDGDIIKLIKEGLANHKVFQSELLELLKKSEEDRESLQNKLSNPF